MNSIIRDIYILLIVLFTCVVHSQEKRLKKADESFDKFAYVDARKVYLTVVGSGYESIEILKKIGDSYYFNAQLEEALPWYEKLIDKHASEIEPEYQFRYSQSLKSLKRYKEADNAMAIFDQMIGQDKRAEHFRNSPDYLDKIELQSGKFELVHLEVNSEHSDYAPSFNHQGQLVFATARIDKGISKTINKWNEKSFLDLVSSSINFNTGTLSNPKPIKGDINTMLHESTSTFTKDGKTVYFTRNNLLKKKVGKNKKGSILLKIYKATLEGNKWVNVLELPFNSDEYSVAHPALSADGSKLYFASDMPGTNGLSDIYVVDILEGGAYSEPRNLGDKINTEGRETFPYITDSGRLYFASDGHLGLGGLDVFVSEPNETNVFVNTPINIGKPINSSHDDFTFVLNEETKIGYLASNRPGGKGDDDIYRFKQLQDIITKCIQNVSGVITDRDTKSILPYAEVVLLDNQNNEINRVKANNMGEYYFNIDCGVEYNLKASKESYDPAEVRLLPKDELVFNHILDLGLQGKLRKELKEGEDLAKLLELQPIYFDLGKAFIRPDAEIELQKIIAVLKQYPDLKIDVRSHTDSRAKDYYNLTLSENRAKNTINYIVTKGGIDEARVKGRGYGESWLLNKCSNGLPCSEEEHQKNRRSEFIIVSY